MTKTKTEPRRLTLPPFGEVKTKTEVRFSRTDLVDLLRRHVGDQLGIPAGELGVRFPADSYADDVSDIRAVVYHD